MDQVHVVRHKVLVEGRSQRAVARELGLSRVTVRQVPGRRRRRRGRRRPAPRPRPVWDAVGRAGAGAAGRVGAVDGRQAAADRHAAARAAAWPRGTRVGVTVVKDAVAEWKRQRREVFVPLTYRPGDLAEVDFFEVLVDVDGTRRKAWLFLMRLMYSGRDFAWIYERQDQISFLDGHVRAFAHFDGVPARVAYDNLRAAVVADPGRRRAHADAAVRGARLALPARSRVSVGPARATTRAASSRAARPCGSRRSCRFRSAPTLAVINAALLAQMDARLDTTRDAAGQTIGVRFAEEQRQCRPRPDAVRAGGDDVRHGVAARAGAARGRRLLGAESLGRARPRRAHRRDDGDDRRARRDADSASAEALRAAVDRLPALPVGAGAQAAGGAPGAAGSPARSGRPVSGDLGSAPRRRMGRGRPRGSSPRSSASSRRTAPRSSCPR